jgi:hypothetical protein
MSLIAGYFTRDACIFPGCDEPPSDDRDVCAYHKDVHVSTWGSWLEVEAS